MALVLDQSNAESNEYPSNLRYGAAENVYLAQQFTPSVAASIGKVSLRIKRTGSPSGNIWAEIWSDSGSDAPSTLISPISATVSAGGVSTSFADVDFTFTNGPQLDNGVKYWIVFNGDYASSATDNILWDGDNPGTYGSGVPSIYNGTSWNNLTQDYNFSEYYDDTLTGSRSASPSRSASSSQSPSASISTSSSASISPSRSQSPSGSPSASLSPSGSASASASGSASPTISPSASVSPSSSGSSSASSSNSPSVSASPSPATYVAKYSVYGSSNTD